MIAWDKTLLVADGRSTIGDNLVADKEWKLREVNHPTLGKFIGAFCGAVMVIEPWIAHIEQNGFEPFETPDDSNYPGMYDTTAILVNKAGRCIELETTGLFATVTEPAAWGSGQHIAQHYLNNGVEAVEAVREACKSHLSCGGRIIAWDFASQKFRVYER